MNTIPAQRFLHNSIFHALALLVFLLATACSRSVPDTLEKAKAYHAKGENAAAIIELNNVRVEQPNNPLAFFLSGLVLADLGDLVKAENALRRALEYGQPAAEVLPALGRVLLELEKYAEILDALKSDPKFESTVMAELAVLRGRAYVGMGDLAEAKAQFLLAANVRPAEAKLGFARIAAAGGDFAAADKLVDEALAAEKDNADAWILRGDLFRAQAKVDDAIAAYEQAMKAAPRNPVAMVNRALIRIEQGQYSDAQLLLDKAGSIAEASALVHYGRALLASKGKRYGQVNAELARVFDAMPKYKPALLLAGSTNYITGRYDLAQQALARYVADYPEDVYARKLLGATLIAKGQPHLAINILDPLLPKTTDAGSLALAAEANRQIGQTRRAESLLEAALKLEPKSSELRTSLGIVRLAAGLGQRGIADLEAAIELNPASVRADEALIIALLGEKKVERAAEAVAALEKRFPDRAETLTLKGALLLAKNDDANARASFERALQISPTNLTAAEALASIDTREGRPDALRVRIEEVLKHDGKHLGALLALARLDAAAGRQEQSVSRIRLAIAANPNAINAMLMLAQTQLQFGNAAEAVVTAQQAAKTFPYDTRAYKLLADAQLAAGDTAGAIVSLTTLTEAQPNVPNWYQHLTRAYMAQGDYRTAQVKAAKALAIDPANLTSQALLGDIYLQTRDFAKAQELALRIQREWPKAAVGYALEGNALFARKDFAGAASVLQRAVALDPNGDLLIKIYEAQRALPGGKSSEAPLLDWLKKRPNDVQVRFHVANSYNRMAQYREAAEQYREVLKLTPKDFRVLNNLAWVLHKSGDPQALEFAQQARQISPEDAATNDTLGVIMLSQGKPVPAVQILMKAVSLDGTNSEIRFHLVQALLKAGDTDSAKTELRTVLRSGKPFPELEEARALAGRLGG